MSGKKSSSVSNSSTGLAHARELIAAVVPDVVQQHEIVAYKLHPNLPTNSERNLGCTPHFHVDALIRWREIIERMAQIALSDDRPLAVEAARVLMAYAFGIPGQADPEDDSSFD